LIFLKRKKKHIFFRTYLCVSPVIGSISAGAASATAGGCSTGCSAGIPALPGGVGTSSSLACPIQDVTFDVKFENIFTWFFFVSSLASVAQRSRFLTNEKNHKIFVFSYFSI
jgi:hypothetical protein